MTKTHQIGELLRGIENDRRRIHELETALLKVEQERDGYKAAWSFLIDHGPLMRRIFVNTGHSGDPRLQGLLKEIHANESLNSGKEV